MVKYNKIKQKGGIFTKITEFEPKKVFYYFSEIAKIPHGSGNTRQIEQYCLDFAAEHGLKSYHDPYGNVMIFKEGTKGREQSAPIILQGHLDMVCEKLPECKKDMEQEGIDIFVDGDQLRADGTTLGGDDGIAVAYILALLASDEIAHPPIEALLTVDEEAGLRGSHALDASLLKGRRLINLDSEEEGVMMVSCAGGTRVSCEIPVDMVLTENMCAKKITVGGLLGGHSGIDIHKNRKNAVKVLGGLLYRLNAEIPIRIADISAGGRLNAITSLAEAVICLDGERENEFEKIVAEADALLKEECAATELEAHISQRPVPVPEKCTEAQSTGKIIFSLMQAPYGVRAMNTDIPHMVRTSVNLGEAKLEENVLKLNFMIRSNVDVDKEALERSIRSLVEYIGGTLEVGDSYPAWEYRPDSPLRDTMEAVYEKVYGKKPVISSIHAGLECGVLTGKLPGADMVSIGPTMKNVHTPKESLDIPSVERVWKYLLQVLKMLS